MKKITLAVACYNEKDNVYLMYEALNKQKSILKEYEVEIMFADNNSTDGTQEILRDIAEKDKSVKVIINQTNFGASRSGTNLLSHTTGDGVISIPCDFQEPPELIPEFVRYWEEGYDIVWGQKTQSDENKIKYFLRNCFYFIIQLFAEYPQLRQVTGFGIMDRKVLDIVNITKMQDPQMGIRNLIGEYGFSIKLIPYRQNKRRSGKSSYTIASYFAYALTTLCNTSMKPLRLTTIFGIFTSFLSLITGILYFVYKLTHWNSFSVGIAPLVIGMFFLGSVQLLCIGILGEYISVILRKVTKKLVVVEKELINFNEDDND